MHKDQSLGERTQPVNDPTSSFPSNQDEMGKMLISWWKEGKNGQGLESENGDTSYKLDIPNLHFSLMARYIPFRIRQIAAERTVQSPSGSPTWIPGLGAGLL